ncbi:beta-ketoacyl-ACP synthase [Calothrix sp. 336/3]|uniref:beta-ketoacyl-ACP synthase n=1 Tax=Calothrix sp. 336/3 TaxID=1337936 RepID=UPI0004E3E5F7|nr:beta-ketoacyl-ACP synthase [Calothrix sp. 336/3]AKG20052.1 3-oxoacyl-ACP synthase [Calothrix sp. 336/3]
MNRVFITGIGLVSALGNSLGTSWQNLIANQSGIQLHQPFAELGKLPLGLIANQPVELSDLTQLVVDLALQDANILTSLEKCAVVVGSSRSHQGVWERMLRGEENLDRWLETLPHMNAIAVARRVGTTGIVLAPMAACSTGIWAISQAAMLIQTGQCQRAIAGAVEAAITPLTINGFRQMGALAKTGAYPFDVRREGLVLGEGGAIFVLESAELAYQRQAQIYGEILGFGLTADGYHPNAPNPSGKSAIAAIQQCLQRSRLQASDINYIHAHGTGTEINDATESLIIRNMFSQQVAVSSTKGATGHTIGASGALGVAFSLMALREQILPPCVGLQNPEYDLNFVRRAELSKINYALCLSFGFGGQNGAIALGKIEF